MLHLEVGVAATPAHSAGLWVGLVSIAMASTVVVALLLLGVFLNVYVSGQFAG